MTWHQSEATYITTHTSKKYKGVANYSTQHDTQKLYPTPSLGYRLGGSKPEKEVIGGMQDVGGG